MLELREAILALSPKLRDVLLLRYLLGCSEEETAAALGIRLGTLKSRTNRARAALAELLRWRLGRGGGGDDLHIEELLAELAERTPAPPRTSPGVGAASSRGHRGRSNEAPHTPVRAACGRGLRRRRGRGRVRWPRHLEHRARRRRPSFTGVGFLPAKGWTVVQAGRLGLERHVGPASNVPLDPDDDLATFARDVDSSSATALLTSTDFTRAATRRRTRLFRERSLPCRLSAEPSPASRAPSRFGVLAVAARSVPPSAETR